VVVPNGDDEMMCITYILIIHAYFHEVGLLVDTFLLWLSYLSGWKHYSLHLPRI
jgi:hypothetical protein